MNRRYFLALGTVFATSPAWGFYGLPRIMKQEGSLIDNLVEATPISFQGNLWLVGFHYTGTRGTHVSIHDYLTGDEIWSHPWQYGFGCAMVEGDIIHIWGTSDWGSFGNSIHHATISADFTMGPTKLVYQAPSSRRLFNTSVCPGPDGYVMAVEFQDEKTSPFTSFFLKGADLVSWEEFGGFMYPEAYAACPTIRYHDGWYYIIYLRKPDSRYVSFITRTNDFLTFNGFPGNANFDHRVQVLAPSHPNEGINNSDVDLCEHGGKTYFTFATGNQMTWAHLKTAFYPGTMAQFFAEYWP